MTVHEQLALVSPRDGWAGWLSDDCRVVRLISPESQKGKAVDAGNYTSRFPDTAVVQADDADMVISRLADFQENSLALDFLLLLFDTQVSHETRASVAVELEKILADNACAQYVLDILLASPLPQSAEVSVANDVVEGHPAQCRCWQRYLRGKIGSVCAKCLVSNVQRSDGPTDWYSECARSARPLWRVSAISSRRENENGSRIAQDADYT